MRRIILIGTFISVISCQNKEKDNFENFTFFEGSIRMRSYLKFNSSDTVYYLEQYSLEENELQYLLINQQQKEKLNHFISELKFPKKDSVFINEKVNDGTTFAFSIEKEGKTKHLMIHGGEGPKAFWAFGKWIDSLKRNSKLRRIEKDVKFDRFDDMIYIPPPPPKLDSVHIQSR